MVGAVGPAASQPRVAKQGGALPASVDFAAFSYLAAVTTLHVARMPREDYGASVTAVERFVAADGPIALGVASSLGRSTRLVSNPVGSDGLGEYVLQTLRNWGVACVRAPEWPNSPSSTVVASREGTRTFFPFLPGVLEHLATVSLDDFTASRWAYVDCYEVLGAVTERPVRARLASGGALMVNLGGSPLPPWLDRSRLDRRVALLQTSVTDGDLRQAQALERELAATDAAELIVVSAGSAGAIASDSGTVWRVTAPRIEARRTQGAGSALSAGLVDRLLELEDLPDAVRFGCAMGTAWCLEADGIPSAAILERVHGKTLVSRVDA
jgi:sugar/nucleoside kinase (ribokinase family)